jgi:hypothetical protein
MPGFDGRVKRFDLIEKTINLGARGCDRSRTGLIALVLGWG